jgi:exocyst complex component 2
MKKIHLALSKEECSSMNEIDRWCSTLRKKNIPIDASPAMAQAYLLSSRTFSPAQFLANVHSSSSYPTLASGLENLQESLQQESGALKQLVTGDFDRFVRCKNGIDEVYERMTEGGFNIADDFGTLRIKKTLDGESL